MKLFGTSWAKGYRTLEATTAREAIKLAVETGPISC